MKNTVLITGGMGYLGGRVAIGLMRDANWQVRIASRKPLPPPSWLPQAQMAVMDLASAGTVEKALDGTDAVVHFAALNEIDSLADPKKALEVNTQGTLSLLDAAVKAGVKRFIYFSTAHVYGAPLIGHITERSLPRPVHPYAITHHAAEEFVLAAHDKGAMTGIVLRLSNGYGAPAHTGIDRWTLLVNDLCRQVVETRKLVLRSSGLQQRDFITLHDVARVTAHMLGLPRAGCADGLFNVGGECSMTVASMAERIMRCCPDVLGYMPELVRPQPSSGEVSLALRYDISKLKATGFELRGDMDEEISQTLKVCAAMALRGRV